MALSFFVPKTGVTGIWVGLLAAIHQPGFGDVARRSPSGRCQCSLLETIV